MKSRISACMIVKNEEKILPLSLKSISKIVDEIVIVDTGSTDKTLEIAQSFTPNIHNFTWVDDFAAARNFALELVETPYVLTWDADWVLHPAAVSFIQNLKQKNYQNLDMLYFTWVLDYVGDGQNLDLNDFSLQPTRSWKYHFIFKKDKFIWKSPIHNYLTPRDQRNTIKSQFFPDVEVYHLRKDADKSWRHQQTLGILEKNLDKSSAEYIRLLGYYARELFTDKQYSLAKKTYLEYFNLFTDSDQEEAKAEILESIAFCCIQDKNPSEAVTILQPYFEQFKKFPRYLLALADCSVFLNPHNGLELYLEYLKSPLTKSATEFDYNSERFLVHPQVMVGKLYMIDSQPLLAKKHLQIAREITVVPKTKLEIDSILTQVTNVC